MKKITKTLCMLFIASCMGTATQAAAEEINYMAGWDANGATDQSPYDAGWRTTSTENITWADCDPINANYYQYRDNLGVGRTFIHPKNDFIFSYPLATLQTKKFYMFSCCSAKMSGNNDRPTTFAINSKADGTGVILGTDKQNAKKWNLYTNHSFRFVPVTNEPYYLTWQTQTQANESDRSLAWNFKIVELGNALTVTFNTNEGSIVAPQYLLEGADEKAMRPTTEPTRAGYIFKGWYSDAKCRTEYDFTSPVTTDITIYAGWQDIKEELKTLVSTATDLLNSGTESGIAYLQASIDAANTVIDNTTATTEEVTAAFNNLTTTIAIYQDASLSDLQINGNTVSGFSTTTYQYAYSLAPSVTEVPVVSANANAVCADVAINQASQLPGETTVIVTAGNGMVKTYTVNFAYNYLSGWVGNTTPGDAGWLTPNDITWSDLNTAAGRNCYRDGLASGGSERALVGSPNNKFAYPITGLSAGKVYTFSCTYKWVSNGNAGEDRRWTFGVNTAIDGTDETMLSKVTGTDGGPATATFSFYYSGENPIYLVWNGNAAAYAIDKLLLVETVITSSNIGTFSDNSLSPVQNLLLEGDFTAENITTLNAKLGANSVLTSVDLTKATVAADATDIFAALNPNALKYFAEGSSVPADWTNAVIGNTATAIALTDGYSFHNSKAFTASTISYKRAFTKGWSTFCLPFAIADITELGTIEKYMEVKENTIVFDAATEIMAGNPYLISVENEAEKTFSASNAEVPVTVAEAGIFNATFRELTGAEAEGKFILTDEGETQTFETATTETTIPAFRAYISIENPSSQRFSVEHKSNGPNAIEKINANKSDIIVHSSADGKITIEATTAQYVKINSIDGRLLKTASLAEGESMTIDGLAAGIYLINNHKVAIK